MSDTVDKMIVECTTVWDLEQVIAKLREWKYMDEMSDDYAFSNGKSAYWQSKIQIAQSMREKFSVDSGVE
jgi:hypothetical protein